MMPYSLHATQTGCVTHGCIMLQNIEKDDVGELKEVITGQENA
jgi:hypothetical protein